MTDTAYTYLDYAATSPLCEEAAEAMAPFMAVGVGGIALGCNANSLHTPGRAAFEAMERARKSAARSLGARRPDEIIFTAGATESDDAALFGLARAARDARKRAGKPTDDLRIITTTIEHDAVLAPARQLAAEGFDVVYLKPDRQGFVSAEQLCEQLNDRTVLVSVQAANSEVGSIQPIAQLCEAAHRAGALFHTDAVQALGKTPVELQEWGVDVASFSAHKIGGPKGVGALYLKARTPFQAYLLGGGQESGKRSGTQNVMGIVGFAAALEHSVAAQADETKRLQALRDKLYTLVGGLKSVEPTVDVFSGKPFLPNIVHVLVDGVESETLILRLDKEGFGVSGGSACSSHSLEPSHVLKSMGVSTDKARGALRVSMGRWTTEEDIDRFAEAFSSSLAWKRR